MNNKDCIPLLGANQMEVWEPCAPGLFAVGKL